MPKVIISGKVKKFPYTSMGVAMAKKASMKKNVKMIVDKKAKRKKVSKKDKPDMEGMY